MLHEFRSRFAKKLAVPILVSETVIYPRKNERTNERTICINILMLIARDCPPDDP